MNCEQSFDVNEWIKDNLFSNDVASDIGMNKPGAPVSSSNHINPNQQYKAIKLEQNQQVGAMTNLGTVSGMQQQQILSQGNQAASNFMTTNQESFNGFQQAVQIKSEQNWQQISQQSGLETEYVNSQLPTFSFSQSRNHTLVDQLRSETQSQMLLNKPPLESIRQVQLANSMEWVDTAFQQILLMKEMYLSIALTLRTRALQQRQQATNPEAVAKYGHILVTTGKILRFLQSSRSDVLQTGKEKVFKLMQEITLYLHLFTGSSSFPQQVEASSNHLRTPQQPQRENIFQFYGNAPTSLPESFRQRGDSSLGNSSMGSFEVGLSPGVQNVDASLYRAHQGIAVSSPYESSQIGFDQRGLIMPSAGFGQGTLQPKVTSSQNIFNPFDSSVSSITGNSVSTSSQKNKGHQAMTTPNMAEPLEHSMSKKKSEDSQLRHSLGCNKSLSVIASSKSSPSSVIFNFAAPSPSASQSTVPSPLKSNISKPSGSEKSSLSFEKSSVLPKTSPSPFELTLQRLLNSPLFKESTNSSDDQSSNAKEDPVKRSVKVPSDHLLKEIKEINQRLLMEAVVDVMNVKDEATLIKVSYYPIGLTRGNYEMAKASPNTFPYLHLELMVKADYPNSSPVMVETQSPIFSWGEEDKDMWMKAKSNFSLFLRTLPELVSLKEMAKKWESCAREVYREFALRQGGGDLTSTYGTWEKIG